MNPQTQQDESSTLENGNTVTTNDFIWFADKELDIIEMAVYGDVIRPGNQCRCRSIDELLGKYKPKDHTAPCKLP
ncbi:hypothetical protein E3N88_41501 [Mikania micrantha]|uniref:Uncharacterized protein n=1 Tax=Mikania micrantha TaxID=192012 RepID=A0A5N6LLB9_9ASTR|nr:hypothetical protein E3N88_41501 [Mikania micrantha]